MQKLTFDPYKIEEFEIGGVPVYTKALPWATGWVEIRIGMRAGAMQDELGKEGTAHFFEHLPFNGTKKYPTFIKMDELGRTLFMDTLNAYTSMSGTCFTGKMLLSDMDKALDVLRDMVFFPTLELEEIERERKVIMQEIWRSFSNTKREKLIQEVHKDLYGNLPHAKQVNALGWSFVLPNINKEDLEKFHSKHYHKGNLFFVIAGDIKKKELTTHIKNFLKDLPEGKRRSPDKKIKPIPSPIKDKIEISDKEYFGSNEESKAKATNIRAERLLPKASPSEGAKIWLTRDILRQLIFNELRGKFGGTYSPRVDWRELLGHEYFGINLEVAPELQDKAIEIIKDSILKIARADKSILNIFNESKRAGMNYIITRESSGDDITDSIIHDVFRDDEINTIKEILEIAEKVTFKSVAKYVKDNIEIEKLYWSIVKP